MLPIVLVLLVATSAFAAPSVLVSQNSINNIPRAPLNGGLNGNLIDAALEAVDAADSNIYILTVQEILKDLANSGDSRLQAVAVGQTIALLGELARGVPGDACAAASAIDGSVSGRGNDRAFLSQLASSIDAIAQVSANAGALRYASGPRGNCANAGRTYQFEAAWDTILNSASPYEIGLVNEEYCAAKRLYNAVNARSNNVGAAVTAAALPQVVSSVQRALPQLINFLNVVASGANASGLAGSAKNALLA